MSDSEGSSVKLVVEATLPYRWDGTSVVWNGSSASSDWSVVAEAGDPEEETAPSRRTRRWTPVIKWKKIVTSIFAIRQLQQWFSSAGTGLKQVNPAIRDRVAKELGR